MSLFRNVDLALIIMTFGFPVVLLIVSRNILAFFVCLLESAFNSFFGFSFLILIGRKISSIFSNEAQSGKRANLIRIGTMIGYFAIVFGASFMIQGAIYLINYFKVIFANNAPPLLLNVLLSLIPLPITQGYIVSLAIYGNYFSLELLFSSLLGVALFVLIVWGLYRSSIKSLHEVTLTEFDIRKLKTTKREDEVKVGIQTDTPLKTYLRKDLISASHDMQTFIFIMMPIIYPIIMLVSFQGLLVQLNDAIIFGIIVWIIVLGVFSFSPLMIVVGLLNMEESGSSIIASLPVLPRDQARAKLLLMAVVQIISLSILTIVIFIMTASIEMFLLLVCSLPLIISFLLLSFELKVYLFGKLKYKYILEELHKGYKIQKWLLILLGDIGLFFMVLILGISFFFYIGIYGTIIVALVSGGVSFLILGFVFNRMFPSSDKIQDYETGGFLRNHPFLAGIIIVIFFLIFSYIASNISTLLVLLFSIFIHINLEGLIISDTLVQFAFLALLLFVVIPLGFKLPSGQKTFREYSENIKLNTIQPALRNILIPLVAIGIFIVVSLLGGLLINTFSLGVYIIDPNVIFGKPYYINPIFINYGWTIFIVMLVPAIWEEVTFRGVMIPMLMKKNNVINTIILSSLIFGFAHFNNLLSGTLAGYFSLDLLFQVSGQVIFATFLGFTLAYMFIKTKSIFPGIIFHFLINTIAQLFLQFYFYNNLVEWIFLIIFIDIIPSILIILLVKLIVNDDKIMYIGEHNKIS